MLRSVLVCTSFTALYESHKMINIKFNIIWLQIPSVKSRMWMSKGSAGFSDMFLFATYWFYGALKRFRSKHETAIKNTLWVNGWRLFSTCLAKEQTCPLPSNLVKPSLFLPSRHKHTQTCTNTICVYERMSFVSSIFLFQQNNPETLDCRIMG